MLQPVQYVRGMPIIKIFGQSIRSFRQFNAEIEAYKTFALKCCNNYQNGIIAFIILLNSIVTFILPVGILIMTSDPKNISLAAIYLFFIVMGPGVASPVYKLAFLASGTVEINEGVKRIDKIFEEKKLCEPVVPQIPQTYDIEFRNVSFAYEDRENMTKTEALKDISFIARQGEVSSGWTFWVREVNNSQSHSSLLGCFLWRDFNRGNKHKKYFLTPIIGDRVFCIPRYVSFQ